MQMHTVQVYGSTAVELPQEVPHRMQALTAVSKGFSLLLHILRPQPHDRADRGPISEKDSGRKSGKVWGRVRARSMARSRSSGYGCIHVS
eukprot:COSAG01_NODE_333_length_18717_cov_40.372072_17_plen_90_part_00